MEREREIGRQTDRQIEGEWTSGQGATASCPMALQDPVAKSTKQTKWTSGLSGHGHLPTGLLPRRSSGLSGVSERSDQ